MFRSVIHLQPVGRGTGERTIIDFDHGRKVVLPRRLTQHAQGTSTLNDLNDHVVFIRAREFRHEDVDHTARRPVPEVRKLDRVVTNDYVIDPINGVRAPFEPKGGRLRPPKQHLNLVSIRARTTAVVYAKYRGEFILGGGNLLQVNDAPSGVLSNQDFIFALRRKLRAQIMTDSERLRVHQVPQSDDIPTHDDIVNTVHLFALPCEPQGR